MSSEDGGCNDGNVEGQGAEGVPADADDIAVVSAVVGGGGSPVAAASTGGDKSDNRVLSAVHARLDECDAKRAELEAAHSKLGRSSVVDGRVGGATGDGDASASPSSAVGPSPLSLRLLPAKVCLSDRDGRRRRRSSRWKRHVLGLQWCRLGLN